MALRPKVAETPLELMTPDLEKPEPFLSQIWGGALFGTATFLAVCFGNFATKRPVFSGIQRHIVLTGLAIGLGQYVDNYRKGYLAERDAVFRHYIQLHPEDFPAIDRIKYSQVLEPWIPIR